MAIKVRQSKETELVAGYEFYFCFKCRTSLPSVLFTEVGGACRYCVRASNQEERTSDPYFEKANNTFRRHASRLPVTRAALIEHYGWDVQRMRDDLERAAQLPCPYCQGLLYGGRNTPMIIQGLREISLDVQNPKEPYYNFCRWCCFDCNRAKSTLSTEVWQVWCSHLERWINQRARLQANPYTGTLLEGVFDD